MAFSITDLKKGTIFELDDVAYKVVEYQQKAVGRGGSVVSLKLKRLSDSQQVNKTLWGNEAISPVDLSRKTVVYLYKDQENYFFMDEQSFEQFILPTQEIEEQKDYLTENCQVTLLLVNNQSAGIELPNSLHLKVKYTEDVVRGDTTSNVQKDAVLESGMSVKVPAFIKIGDTVKVDTRKGTYLERSK